VLRVRLREALRSISGVQFVDTLPGVRPSQPGAPGGRRKRFTDALTDTIGAITPPKGNLAIGTPVSKAKVGTENTLLATAQTPSMISRRKWASTALVVATLAIAMVVGAIVIAMRPKHEAVEPRPVAKPADQVQQMDAGAQVVEQPAVTPDAAVVALQPPQDPPPAKKAAKPKTTAKADHKVEPAKVEPVKADPPKPDPPAKKCVKGSPDYETCMFGDGT
jgi:hypothetical protein